MLLHMRFYQKYPAFCVAVNTIQREYIAAILAVPGQPETTKRHTIEEAYRRQIDDAIKKHQVPLFASWQEVLKETGQAVFQYALPQEDMPSIQAKLHYDDGTDDIILTMTQTRVFPKLLPEEEHEQSREKRIGLYLLSQRIYTDSWLLPRTPTPSYRIVGLIRLMLQRIRRHVLKGKSRSSHHHQTAISM